MTKRHPNISTADLIELYNTGLSATQIGTKVGMWKTAVSYRLKKAGIKLKKSSDYSGDKRYWLWKGKDLLDPITRKRNQRLHRKWSLAVRTRDNHKCRECGVTKVRLHAHHIIFLEDCINSKLEFDIDNGITLCPPCHKAIH